MTYEQKNLEEKYSFPFYFARTDIEQFSIKRKRKLKGLLSTIEVEDNISGLKHKVNHVGKSNLSISDFPKSHYRAVFDIVAIGRGKNPSYVDGYFIDTTIPYRIDCFGKTIYSGEIGSFNDPIRFSNVRDIDQINPLAVFHQNVLPECKINLEKIIKDKMSKIKSKKVNSY